MNVSNSPETLLKPASPRSASRRKLAALAIALVFVLLSFGTAATRRPFCDEAWFASPALNLATKGYFGTSNLEFTGTYALHMDRRTYYEMPLFLVAEAAWFKVVGFSLTKDRLLSTVFGLLALWGVYAFVKRLSGNAWTGLFAAAILGCDYMFVGGAATGRMDMMAAALGVASWPVYLLLRETSLPKAILASHAMVACALFTHPNALPEGIGLVFLAFWFDLRRLRIQHLFLASIPYLACAAGWGLYIAQDPQAFVAQLSGNATQGRENSSLTWLVFGEIRERYLGYFGLGPESSGAARLKLLVLASYWAAAASCFLTPAIRRNRNYRALLVLFGITYLFMTFLERKKSNLYLVHIMPLYAAMLAVWVAHLWEQRPAQRRLIAAAASLLLLIQTGGLLAGMRMNPYRRDYLPLVEAIRSHSKPGDLIMGNASLCFELGYVPNLIDDFRLGYYSHRKPALVVMDRDYRNYLESYEKSQPEIYRHMNALLASATPVYQNGSDTVFAFQP